MYEYDNILNGKTSRDTYAEKLNQAENTRKANNVTKNNPVRNLLSNIISIIS